MLFNSFAFIFGYLPATMAGFFLLAKSSHRLASLWLAVASLFFYGWWNPLFVLLVITSISLNYSFGYAIGHARLKSEKNARVLLTASVVINLAVLSYFKYANFFVFNISQLTGIELAFATVVLPLGISFFTFTQIAFLVDVYRGVAREYNFIHYTLFVVYFPHLIAGPVLHHKQMMPQFGHADTYRISIDNINNGVTIFIIGLAKKVLLADQFALYSSPIFDSVAQGGEPKFLEAWIGALAYSLQIYFDFSGYSDMAIGLSRMFNVTLPQNFNSPYKASNIIEFWRRWHMTLSAFLRDYLYVPLGGSRKGELRRYVNVMLTMLLGGLWHGAGWTFVIWGGLHGVYLIVNHGWRRLSRVMGTSSGWHAAIGVFLTFLCVVVAWVPFRAPSLDATMRMWIGMFGINGISFPQGFQTQMPKWLNAFAVFDGIAPLTALGEKELAIMLPIGLGIIWLLPNVEQWMATQAPALYEFKKPLTLASLSRLGYSIGVGALFGLSLLSLNRASEFLYFQF